MCPSPTPLPAVFPISFPVFPSTQQEPVKLPGSPSPCAAAPLLSPGAVKEPTSDNTTVYPPCSWDCVEQICTDELHPTRPGC